MTSAIYVAGLEALEHGRLDEAAEHLERARHDESGNPQIARTLGICYYRANHFARASEAFGNVDGMASMVAKLRTFGDERPYQVKGATSTTLPFLQTDPLPVVRLDVEGRETYAVIDTGGSELHIDSQAADEIGLPRFGPQEGIFAGGHKASYEHSRVEHLMLGTVELRAVPCMLLPTRRFSAVTLGRWQIDAIIGTNLLAQFRSTLDYPGSQLVLEQPSGDAQPLDGVLVPFETWDFHLMIAEGFLNGIGGLRYLVDSGLAGGAFTCPERTLKRARIAVPDSRIHEGSVGGGGGQVASAGFHIEELGLGPLRQQSLNGIYIPGTFDDRGSADEARSWRDRVDGLISHGFLRRYRWTIEPRSSTYGFVEDTSQG